MSMDCLAVNDKISIDSSQICKVFQVNDKIIREVWSPLRQSMRVKNLSLELVMTEGYAGRGSIRKYS